MGQPRTSIWAFLSLLDRDQSTHYESCKLSLQALFLDLEGMYFSLRRRRGQIIVIYRGLAVLILGFPFLSVTGFFAYLFISDLRDEWDEDKTILEVLSNTFEAVIGLEMLPLVLILLLLCLAPISLFYIREILARITWLPIEITKRWLSVLAFAIFAYILSSLFIRASALLSMIEKPIYQSYILESGELLQRFETAKFVSELTVGALALAFALILKTRLTWKQTLTSISAVIVLFSWITLVLSVAIISVTKEGFTNLKAWYVALIPLCILYWSLGPLIHECFKQGAPRQPAVSREAHG